MLKGSKSIVVTERNAAVNDKIEYVEEGSLKAA